MTTTPDDSTEPTDEYDGLSGDEQMALLIQQLVDTYPPDSDIRTAPPEVVREAAQEWLRRVLRGAGANQGLRDVYREITGAK